MALAMAINSGVLMRSLGRAHKSADPPRLRLSNEDDEAP